ncbi:uncharacterized protein TRIADDRAFT_27324 [Trichoplax adhaerens]|uniref:Dynamin-like GTPase OPA1, mitochondrial n=1 Tax=Trichoplax adhaerens TaxID=10228 RepID=B3RZ80_TRIAD|nr:hypothetical protein TRIADDRAFT_27324 [Trichoplax adhaerens]EDV24155.1 hypothetical protein TRIADDRAFT_27324 [Trichoplax adhaerens]|eukprot:XP_002113681.1 hypothetical protein TRIADDRAFT_27324 [Trichoplax adhaerens]
MSEDAADKESLKERADKAERELVEIQQRLQHEIDKLEKTNRDLRQQILKMGKSEKAKYIKKSLIDMYSDVLDLLADYDANYDTQDSLPRVVVVGDQSAGKTSVLEMIARARIFPRGSGEMMTRSPVMVTLSEGPRHIAQFKNNDREYDLNQEPELNALRQEVERRMKASVQNGQTVSHETISMSVKGPGLQRMVLVDLPGIISTVTAGMATSTREDIIEMSKKYMKNPNSIILCIQDGSVDAERSIVTDLVNSVDKQGKRTIFVLTKADLAEKSLANPDRIKKTLEGRLFPMKALGYFAVVTGRGNTEDSIETIRQHEEEYFRNSKLFRSNVIKATQMNTQNLSRAVSECFWKMVKESVEQQSDSYQAIRFNLETEWKNRFPGRRELDRNELFDRGKAEILDTVLTLSQLQPMEWYTKLKDKLWLSISEHFVENIYIPAAQTESSSKFNTYADIKLKEWSKSHLSGNCVTIGWETLLDEFAAALRKNVAVSRSAGMSSVDNKLFDDLKEAVINICNRNHTISNNNIEKMHVIQSNALEDLSVPDKQQWESAAKFLEETLNDKLKQAINEWNQLTGPNFTERWMSWRSTTPEQLLRQAAGLEFQKLLQSRKSHKSHLDFDEVIMVKRNLETQGHTVSEELIEEIWRLQYRKHFLQMAIAEAQECKGAFFHRKLGNDELQCDAVVLFWRMQSMLNSSSRFLRQQVVNHEFGRLEEEAKQALDEIEDDDSCKKKLLTGDQVILAEKLKKVKHIQSRLVEFVKCLNQDNK